MEHAVQDDKARPDRGVPRIAHCAEPRFAPFGSGVGREKPAQGVRDDL